MERRLPVHHSIIKQFGEPILQCMVGYKVPGFNMHTIDTRRYFREPRIEDYQAHGECVVDESDGANAEEAQLEAQRAFGLRIAAPPGQLQCKVCWKSQPLECFARRRRDVYRAHCHTCVARWGSNFSEARSQHHIVFEHLHRWRMWRSAPRLVKIDDVMAILLMSEEYMGDRQNLIQHTHNEECGHNLIHSTADGCYMWEESASPHVGVSNG